MFRVLTLNLWNDEGPWGDRAQLIRTTLDELQPDVVGVQEALVGSGGARGVDQLAEIGGAFPHRLFVPSKELRPDTAYGNGLLSVHPVSGAERLELPVSELGSPRCALLAELETRFGRWPVVVTHLSWRPQESERRLRQLQLIEQRVSERWPVTAERLPPLWLGDFNADPASEELRFLTEPQRGRAHRYVDCWAAAGDGSAGLTFAHDNGFGPRPHEPARRLDYVLLRDEPTSRLTATRAELAFVTPALVGKQPVWASDHYGVLVTFDVR